MRLRDIQLCSTSGKALLINYSNKPIGLYLLYHTVKFFRNGELLETYTGSKTVDSLKEYLRTMKHRQTEGKPSKPSKNTPKKDGAKSGKKKTSKSEL